MYSKDSRMYLFSFIVFLYEVNVLNSVVILFTKQKIPTIFIRDFCKQLTVFIYVLINM